MARANSDFRPHVASAIVGLVTCLAISIITGRREAWDSGAYFGIGMPLMCMMIFAISYRFPQRVWRWALSMAVGQSVAMVLGGGSLSLWPLALIAMTVLSLPQFGVALLASRMASQPADKEPG